MPPHWQEEMGVSFLSEVISELTHPAVGFDHDGTCLANKKAVELFGESPESKETFTTLLTDGDDELRSRLSTLLEDAPATGTSIEVKHPHINNRKLTLRVGRIGAGEKSATIALIDDPITEESHLTEVERLGRLASIGQITAGVTHELNNVLTAILGWTQMALRDPQRTDRVENALSIVDESSRRAKSIIGDILTIARGDTGPSATVTFGDVSDDVLRILSWELNNAAIVVNRHYRDTSPLAVDRRKLFQVFLNIVLNAIQAMPTGGELRIVTKLSSDIAEIEFRDTGHGMSQETLAHIFEPHFTTKGLSKDRLGGSGLGLAVCRRIVESLDGEISVTSQPDAGAAFSVKIPIVSSIPGRTSHHSFPPLEPVKARSILVVEDETNIRNLLQDALEHDEIVAVGSGIEALALCRRQRFEIAILDYTLPGTSGAVLTQKVRDLLPGIRVLVFSGRAEELTTEGTGADAILTKPFELKELNTILSTLEA